MRTRVLVATAALAGLLALAPPASANHQLHNFEVADDGRLIEWELDVCSERTRTLRFAATLRSRRTGETRRRRWEPRRLRAGCAHYTLRTPDVFTPKGRWTTRLSVSSGTHAAAVRRTFAIR